MSDASETPVTLEFLARQIRGMRDDILALRDDITVLTGIALRHERQLEHLNEIHQATLNQITTMVRQHQRFSERLRVLEEERR
jgi:chromosome condensin MukBEF complex kleisin-like MukF subunit